MIEENVVAVVGVVVDEDEETAVAVVAVTRGLRAWRDRIPRRMKRIRRRSWAWSW